MLSSSPLCVCVCVFALWKESESVNLSVESDTLQPHGLHSPPGSSGLVVNPMDRGAWRDTVHRVAKSWT